jgi:hypothetical protein
LLASRFAVCSGVYKFLPYLFPEWRYFGFITFETIVI